MLSLPWLLTAAATAATWIVPSQFPTIGDAVSAAAAGDTIKVLPGTYVERLRVTQDLVFVGETGAVWVSPFGQEEALEVENATVTVTGILFGSRDRSRAIDVLTGATVIVEDCVIASGHAAEGGGIRAQSADRLVVRRTRFLGNHATGEGGCILARDMPEVEVVDSTFLGCSARDGGAMAFRATPAASVARTWIEDASATHDGAALFLVDSTVALTSSMACRGFAGDDGGVADLSGPSALAARGNLMVLNQAMDIGGALCGDPYSQFDTANNHFVGNAGFDPAGGTVGGTHHTSINDLYAFNGVGVVAHGVSAASLTNAAFFDNDNADTTARLPANTVLADPMLGAWSSCASSFEPTEDSPLIGAGDPTSPWLVHDIGAFSGGAPFAATRPTDDLDGDGAIGAADCDDLDPTVHVGAAEICDGRDNDCDGVMPVNEVDADRDGYLACGDDCDDTRSSVYPGAPERVADGIDQDCDTDELCYADPDGDGFGDPTTVASDDLDCLDAGEANNPDDICPAGDDASDRDADGTPDACDACPVDPTDDSDGDGVCDSDDPTPFGTTTGPTGPIDTGGEPTEPTGTTDTGTAPGPIDTGTPPGPDATDSDGDGIPDAIDPDPGSAGGDGAAQAAPKPSYGCGCTTGRIAGAPSLALLALVGLRRRVHPAR